MSSFRRCLPSTEGPSPSESRPGYQSLLEREMKPAVAQKPERESVPSQTLSLFQNRSRRAHRNAWSRSFLFIFLGRKKGNWSICFKETVAPIVCNRLFRGL